MKKNYKINIEEVLNNYNKTGNELLLIPIFEYCKKLTIVYFRKHNIIFDTFIIDDLQTLIKLKFYKHDMNKVLTNQMISRLVKWTCGEYFKSRTYYKHSQKVLSLDFTNDEENKTNAYDLMEDNNSQVSYKDIEFYNSLEKTKLNDRQKKIIKYICDGFTHFEISELLKVSRSTITHEINKFRTNNEIKKLLCLN